MDNFFRRSVEQKQHVSNCSFLPRRNEKTLKRQSCLRWRQKEVH